MGGKYQKGATRPRMCGESRSSWGWRPWSWAQASSYGVRSPWPGGTVRSPRCLLASVVALVIFLAFAVYVILAGSEVGLAVALGVALVVGFLLLWGAAVRGLPRER